jgi:hypothetical protein
MAQTVCVLLDATDAARLTAIASDRSRPLNHTHQRACIVLLSAERLSVQNVVRRAGDSRPASCQRSLQNWYPVKSALGKPRN